ncbi:hypothetical protein GCM10027614_80910 [Micromonospora vulcania]
MPSPFQYHGWSVPAGPTIGSGFCAVPDRIVSVGRSLPRGEVTIVLCTGACGVMLRPGPTGPRKVSLYSQAVRPSGSGVEYVPSPPAHSPARARSPKCAHFCCSPVAGRAVFTTGSQTPSPATLALAR